MADGYVDIRDIPNGVLTNQNHLRVWEATRANNEIVDAGELQPLKDLDWPRYYLDFETVGLAVPRWKGQRPYAQVPFQWSCHIHHRDKPLQHAEFLDVSGADPRRKCAETLVDAISREGVVVVYNASFERMVIKNLADLYPDLSERLMEIHNQIVDLLPITRNGYYHPNQKGSWSLKAVLPVLAPELSYDALEGVHHGQEAQIAWLLAADAEEEERARIKGQLSEYCKLDTLAMVRVVDALLDKIDS